MPKLTFKVEGRAGMVANFVGTRRAIEQAVLSAVRTYGENTRDTARSLAREDTGKMKRELVDRYSDQGRIAEVGWNEGEFASDGSAPYYIYNELGTSRMSAQPMIGPAHRVHAPVMLREIGAQMRRIARERSAK
jgi:HK97 gp10 family phage protein